MQFKVSRRQIRSLTFVALGLSILDSRGNRKENMFDPGNWNPPGEGLSSL